MPLQTQLFVVQPREKWTLYFVGLINPPSKKNVHILVQCKNYMTQWVEAKALPKDTKQTLVYFLYEELFVQYGIP